jgi:hypothetical protein
MELSLSAEDLQRRERHAADLDEDLHGNLADMNDGIPGLCGDHQGQAAAKR